MLIDQVLPKYDQREYHQIDIRGERREVYQTVRSIDFSNSFIKKRHTCCRFRSNPPSDDDTEYIGISAISRGSSSNRRLLFLYSSMSSRDRISLSLAFSFMDRVSWLFIRINELSTARTNRLNSTAKSVSMKAFFSWACLTETLNAEPCT